MSETFFTIDFLPNLAFSSFATIVRAQGSKKRCVQASTQCASLLSYLLGFFLLFIYGASSKYKQQSLLTLPVF